jgi:hypothetical protein
MSDFISPFQTGVHVRDRLRMHQSLALRFNINVLSNGGTPPRRSYRTFDDVHALDTSVRFAHVRTLCTSPLSRVLLFLSLTWMHQTLSLWSIVLAWA